MFTLWYFSFSFLINVQTFLHFCFFPSRWGAECTLMRNKLTLANGWIKYLPMRYEWQMNGIFKRLLKALFVSSRKDTNESVCLFIQYWRNKSHKRYSYSVYAFRSGLLPLEITKVKHKSNVHMQKKSPETHNTHTLLDVCYAHTTSWTPVCALT